MKIENLTANALPDQHQRLTHEARKWVSQTFFGTMLKQMRSSPFKSELFAGGRGGQAFATLFDQHLADRMSRGAGGKLVDGIVRRIEAKTQKQQNEQRELLQTQLQQQKLQRTHVAADHRA